MDLMDNISDIIKSVNIKFNTLYKIYDSKAKDSIIEFNAEKILTSLITSGVPLFYSCRVLLDVQDKIPVNHKKDTLSTTEIRDYIRTSLHCLESFGVSPTLCQEWGDIYVRKYGNPQGKIQVIHRNGNVDELDFDYIKSSLLPEILSEICETPLDRIPKVFSYKVLVDMANELMRSIQELGLYRIHHRTLLLLVKERALQPPHPWLPTNSSLFDNVKYDIERSEYHLSDMKEALKNISIPQARNSFRECLHHSSSAILSFYHEFLGCGDLSPFHNLRQGLKNLKKEDKIIWMSKSKFKLIEQDLAQISMKLDDLVNITDKLNHLLQIIYRVDAVKESFIFIEQLINISKKLVYGRYNLKSILDDTTKSKSKDKGLKYEKIVADIFNLSPNMTCHCNYKIRGKQVDMVIEHNFKEDPFNEIRKFIYVECKNTDRKTDIEVVEKLAYRIGEKANRFCNTGIIISAKGFTSGAKQEAIKLFDNGILIILLSNRDLYEMIETEIIPYLSAKINLLFFGKIV